MRYFWLVLIIAMGCLFSTPLLAQDAKELRLQNLYNQLRCPTCQGLSVKDSEAGFSVQIRNKVDELVDAGKSDEEIRAFFVKRYGEWILRSPPKEGFNLVLWILPGVGIALALILVWRKSQTWAAKSRKEPEELNPLTAEEQQVLEADMKRFQNS